MAGIVAGLKKMLSLRCIDQGVYCLLLAVAFSNVLSDAFARNLVRVLFLVMLLRICVWKADGVPEGYWDKYRGFAIAMGGFSLVLILSAWVGGDVIHGMMSGNTFWYNFCNMFLVFICGLCRLKRNQIRNIFEAAMLSMLITDIYMYWQAFHGTARASGFYREGAVVMVSIMLDVLLPVLLLLILNRDKIKGHQYFYGIVFVASLFGLLVNGTRGAWLSIIPVLGIILLLFGKNKKRLLTGLLGIIVVGGIVLSQAPLLHQRVVSVSDMQEQAHAERIRIWTGAWHMAQEHPLMGVGLGNYADQYQHKYILAEAKERTISHAHNNFLMMLAENGIVGLLAFCSMFGYFLYWSWKNKSSMFALMIFFVTVIILLHGMVDYTYSGHSALRLYWLFLGLCIKLVNFKDSCAA